VIQREGIGILHNAWKEVNSPVPSGQSDT